MRTGSGKLDGGRVPAVAARDDRVEERDVAHGLRDRADLVEARGEGDDAVARDGAVRRPQADVPAERRRLLDRAARVGAETPGSHSRRHGRSGPPAGSSGTSVGSHGFRDGPEGGVLGGGPHRELVRVRLAEQREPRCLAPRRNRRVEDRDVAGEDPRARRRLDALRRDHVLERDRDARSVPRLDRSQIGVELVVPLRDRLEVRGVELGRRELAPIDEADRILGREPQRVDGSSHHAVGGTRKRSPSRAGAFAKTSSRLKRLARLVLVPDVDDVEGVRRRRNVREIELRTTIRPHRGSRRAPRSGARLPRPSARAVRAAPHGAPLPSIWPFPDPFKAFQLPTSHPETSVPRAPHEGVYLSRDRNPREQIPVLRKGTGPLPGARTYVDTSPVSSSLPRRSRPGHPWDPGRPRTPHAGLR